MYKIGGNDVVGPDLVEDDIISKGPPHTCEEAKTYCHDQASCKSYPVGFCCECKQQYYGNGIFCVKKGALYP